MNGTEIDNHKLMYHPKRVEEWLEKKDCYPVYVEIGPTNRCNHQCIFCALDWIKHGTHDIEKNVMLSSLKDMSEHGVKSVMFAGDGEPLLHKDINEFVSKSKQYGLDVSVTTNGVLFTEKKIEECLPCLSWIRFSVDAGSPEKYSLIHKTNPADFNRVITNIENAVNFKKSNKLETTIGIQFLMIPQNVPELEKLVHISKDIGADNLQIKPYSHHPGSSNDLVIDTKEYNKFEKQLKDLGSKDFEILFRKKTIERMEEGINYPKCYGLPFFALIDARANVIPCNLFYNNDEFVYGNLYDQTFSEIWEGEKRKGVLKKIEERGISECREGCRLDPINRYLHRLENPHPHDNFI